MDLDLSDVLAPPRAPPSDMDRLLAVLAEMQRGINVLTDIVAGHQARIITLEGEARRAAAFRGAVTPKRGPIILPGGL